MCSKGVKVQWNQMESSEVQSALFVQIYKDTTARTIKCAEYLVYPVHVELPNFSAEILQMRMCKISALLVFIPVENDEESADMKEFELVKSDQMGVTVCRCSL